MDEWEDNAACRDKPSGWFFPAVGELHKAAKSVCAACDVRQECLDFALRNHEHHGVWGGLTPGERQRLEDGAEIRLATCLFCNESFTFMRKRGDRARPNYCNLEHLKAHRSLRRKEWKANRRRQSA